jgi:hypothetical protein
LLDLPLEDFRWYLERLAEQRQREYDALKRKPSE